MKMDLCPTDADFDAYWDEESRNKNRNRIRVGRQYQATIPPLLKSGDADSRRLEEVEVLRWKPESPSNSTSFDEYIALAKTLNVWARSQPGVNVVKTEGNNGECPSITVALPSDPSTTSESLQATLRSLSEFLASQHPKGKEACSAGGNGVSSGSEGSAWKARDALCLAHALEECDLTRVRNRLLFQKEAMESDDDDDSDDDESDDGDDDGAWDDDDDENDADYRGAGGKSIEERRKEAQLMVSSIVAADKPMSALCGGLRVHGSLASSWWQHRLEKYQKRKKLYKRRRRCDNANSLLAPTTPTLPSSADHTNRLFIKSESSLLGNIGSAPNATAATQAAAAAATTTPNSGVADTAPPVGSLKFYLDGELVLKLSAAEAGSRGAQWVEAPDNPRVTFLGSGASAGATAGKHQRRLAAVGSPTAKGGGVKRRLQSSAIAWPERGIPQLLADDAGLVDSPASSASSVSNNNNQDGVALDLSAPATAAL